MPKRIDSTELLREYFDKVMVRSKDHAHGVKLIAMAVMGGIVWKSREIKVLELDGDMKNALWMKTGKDEFYFTYDHKKDEIVVKQRSHKGPQLKRFNNTTPFEDVFLFFDGMN